MYALINGRKVPQDRAVVPVMDRCFLYGDGLFETVPVINRRPFLLREHLLRLFSGARFLKLNPPFSPGEVERMILSLIQANNERHAVLRLTLSRGVGKRGYSPMGADSPMLVITSHPGAAPKPLAHRQGWSLVTAGSRLYSADPLTRVKSCSKLHQVLARMEADAAGAAEAVLLNERGEVTEGASSNLFWIRSGRVNTAPVTTGLLPGVTRDAVLRLCHTLGFPVAERAARPAQVRLSDAVFCTVSTLGVVPVNRWDGVRIGSSPWVRKLQVALCSEMLGR